MEITKKEVEELIGDKVLTYKVTKSYRGYKVVKVKVVAVKATDSKEVTITLKPNK
jgi:ABC-type oligopeptide transport system substrate-binding subunit